MKKYLLSLGTIVAVGLIGMGMLFTSAEHLVEQYEHVSHGERIERGYTGDEVEVGDTLILRGVAINNKMTRNWSTIDIDSLLENWTGPVPLCADHDHIVRGKHGEVIAIAKGEGDMSDSILFVAEFYVREDNIDIARNLMTGYINSVSVGIAPKKGTKVLKDRTVYVVGELIELSIVLIPACPEALIYDVYIK